MLVRRHRRLPRLALAILTLAAAVLAALAASAAPALAQAPGVQPPSVDITIPPGEAREVIKEVTTGRLPPKSDFVFMADTTGSMGPSIEDVKANSQAVIDAIEAAGASDARYGVGNYRDTTRSAPCDYLFELDTDLTDADSAKAAIDTWTPGGGCDLPEANFYGLHKVAKHDISWRPGSARFVIWFGDAPSHEPICNALPGYSDPHPVVTEASVTADLVSEGIRVLAFSAASGPGLDADPKPFSFDYPPPCAPDETGTAGQATRIATATGGVHLVNPPGGVISELIIDAIEALPPVDVTIEPVVTCDAPGVTVTFDPTSITGPSGGTVTFEETITVGADTPAGTVTCTVDFTIGGAPAGEEFRQTIVITIPRPPLDHFRSYKLHELGKPGFRPRTVTLEDQFGIEDVRVHKPRELMNPVSKNGEPMVSPEAHLKCYDITGHRPDDDDDDGDDDGDRRDGGGDGDDDDGRGSPHRFVEVRNQFGSLTLRAQQARRLCNPASKSVAPPREDPGPPPRPDVLDHFKCYDVQEHGKRRFVAREVTLRDQFGEQRALAARPELLCNPAKKNTEPGPLPRPGERHLVCYRTEHERPRFRPLFVNIRDQFGLRYAQVEHPEMLCVPSDKKEIPRPPRPKDDDDDDDDDHGRGDD